MKKASQAPNSPRKESIFEKQLSNKVYAALQEKLYRFKGFDVQSRTVRKYPRPVAAHLLGYVGEVSKEKAAKDLQKQRFGYEGDLFKKRQEFVKPIQDRVFNAVQKMCSSKGFDLAKLQVTEQL